MLAPSSATPDPVIISSWGPNSLGRLAAEMTGLRVEAYLAWPLTNLAIFVPFFVRGPYLVKKLISNNGTVGSGLDVGVYDSAGTRLVSAGSTTQTGASTLQEFDVTDTLLGPGRYYMALSKNDATGQIARLGNVDSTLYTTWAVRELTTAYPLPSDASAWVPITRTYVPWIGITKRTLV